MNQNKELSNQIEHRTKEVNFVEEQIRETRLFTMLGTQLTITIDWTNKEHIDNLWNEIYKKLDINTTLSFQKLKLT